MKFISEEIKNLLSEKIERHPYIVIVMECNEDGTNLNVESAMTGNPIMLKGLLSFLNNAYDEISNKIMNGGSSSSKEKLDFMLKILEEIEEISPSENDKLLIKYFPNGKVASMTEETLDNLIKDAKEVLKKLKDKDDTIKLNN